MEAPLERLRRRPGRRTVIAWLVALPWLLWAVVRAFGLEGGGALVPLVAFTPYVAAASVVPIVTSVLLRRWVPAGASVVTGVVLIALVMPRVIADDQPPEGVELRVVSANIYRGKGDLRQLVGLVRGTRADVLAVQELSLESAAELERLGLRRLLPHRLMTPEIRFGNALFSRWPLRKVEAIVTPPRIGGDGQLLQMPRAFLEVPGAAPVEVTSAHPFPPTKGRVESWQEALSSFPPAGEDEPLRVLLGDFNATLDHDAFRDLLAEGYRDAGEVTGRGLDPTWNVGSLIPPPVTIDHVLVDERIGVADYEVHDLEGSDHETLSATLILPREGGYVD